VQGGYTALHLAARYGTIEGLERLLEDLRVHLDAVTEVRLWRPRCHRLWLRTSLASRAGPKYSRGACAAEFKKGGCCQGFGVGSH